MRVTALACVLLLVCSCGGTGGATPVPGDTPGVTDSNLERTRQILETCTLEDLDRFLSILDLFSGAGGGTESPDLQITGINLIAAAVSWTLDVERDAVVDMSGTIRFEDAQGNPTLPFDLDDLLGGLDDLPSLLASIPDGTVLIVDFTSEPDQQMSGNIELTMLGGVPTAPSGQVTINSTDCVIVLDIQDSGGDLIGGEYPEALAYGTITSTSGNIEGNVTFDGTSSVVLDMTIDGSQEINSFIYDLETGELTPIV